MSYCALGDAISMIFSFQNFRGVTVSPVVSLPKLPHRGAQYVQFVQLSYLLMVFISLRETIIFTNRAIILPYLHNNQLDFLN